MVVLSATLLLFWVLLNGTLATDALITGILVSMAIALLFRNGLSFFTEFRATPAAFLAGFLYYIPITANTAGRKICNAAGG